jgi:hypothetical protein
MSEKISTLKLHGKPLTVAKALKQKSLDFLGGM